MQHERTLMFSWLAQLMSSVVLEKHPGVDAAYRKMKNRLGVSMQAKSGKLEHLDPGWSQALVQHSYQHVVEVRQTLGGLPRHGIAGHESQYLDGNHLSGTEHRLKDTRDITAAQLQRLRLRPASEERVADVVMA